MKTKFKNICDFDLLIKKCGLPLDLDVSTVHSTSKKLVAECNANAIRTYIRHGSISSFKDIVRVQSLLYSNSFWSLGINPESVDVELNNDVLEMNNRVSPMIYECSVYSQEELEKLLMEQMKVIIGNSKVKFEELIIPFDKSIKLLTTSEFGEPKSHVNKLFTPFDELIKSLSEDELDLYRSGVYKLYAEEIAYIYRVYSTLYNNKTEDTAVRLELKNGYMFVHYKEINKFDIVSSIKDKNFNKQSLGESFGGMTALINEYPNLLEDLDLKYNSDTSETCISFRTGFDNSVDEEYKINLYYGLMPRVVTFIDNLFIKYGASNLEYKYFMEEALLNLMMHNFRIPTRTSVYIYKDLTVTFGDFGGDEIG